MRLGRNNEGLNLKLSLCGVTARAVMRVQDVLCVPENTKLQHVNPKPSFALHGSK